MSAGAEGLALVGWGLLAGVLFRWSRPPRAWAACCSLTRCVLPALCRVPRQAYSTASEPLADLPTTNGPWATGEAWPVLGG